MTAGVWTLQCPNPSPAHQIIAPIRTACSSDALAIIVSRMRPGAGNTLGTAPFSATASLTGIRSSIVSTSYLSLAPTQSIITITIIIVIITIVAMITP